MAEGSIGNKMISIFEKFRKISNVLYREDYELNFKKPYPPTLASLAFTPFHLSHGFILSHGFRFFPSSLEDY